MLDERQGVFENILRNLESIDKQISQFKQDVLTKQESNNTSNFTIDNSQNSASTKREDNEKFGVVEDRQISVS